MQTPNIDEDGELDEAKLEDQILVTENGSEQLFRFPFEENLLK